MSLDTNLHFPSFFVQHTLNVDCLHLDLYRNGKDKFRNQPPRRTILIQDYLGIESGFTLDRESNTLAIICKDIITVLAVETREILHQWQGKLQSHFCKGKLIFGCSVCRLLSIKLFSLVTINLLMPTKMVEKHYLVHIIGLPPKSKLTCGPARLLLQDFTFGLVSGIPPRLLGHWSLEQLRRYGSVDGKFCFEGGSHCGKGKHFIVIFFCFSLTPFPFFHSIRMSIRFGASPHCFLNLSNINLVKE